MIYVFNKQRAKNTYGFVISRAQQWRMCLKQLLTLIYTEKYKFNIISFKIYGRNYFQYSVLGVNDL